MFTGMTVPAIFLQELFGLMLVATPMFCKRLVDAILAFALRMSSYVCLQKLAFLSPLWVCSYTFTSFLVNFAFTASTHSLI